MLIAASIAPHVCGQLLDAGRQEKIQIIISPQLLAELKLVLGREKFRRWLTEPEARHAAGAIARLGELHQDPPPQPGLTPDPKTTTSSPSRAPPPVDYLISGDQHLTGLHDPLPPVLTPRQLLDQLKPVARGAGWTNRTRRVSGWDLPPPSTATSKACCTNSAFTHDRTP